MKNSKNSIGKSQILFNRVKIITHNGGFHADDVFAVATVRLWLEKNGSKNIFGKTKIEVIRTRNLEIIAKGDFVVDVGGEYNVDKKIFDHHQAGGAGKHPNGIPYSSFGLVWKEYGKDICDSQEVADVINKRIVQPVDAVDNGVDLCNLIYPEVQPYFISDLIGIYNFVPKKKRGGNLDENFLQAVGLVGDVLEREIEMAQIEVEEKKYVDEIYRGSDDKEIIILEKDISDKSWGAVLVQYNEPLYVVKPDGGSQNWKMKTVRKNLFSFESRKDLPKEWAGKIGDELVRETGVESAIFCHNKRFIVVAKTKEGAMELGRLAVED